MNSDLASEKRISEKVKKKFNQDVIIQKRKRIWMTIEKNNELLYCAKWLKDEGFIHLSAISVSDWLKEKKFKLDYILWSFEEKVIFILTIKIDRDNPVIDSVISIWRNNAQAHEREAWEFFGIYFKGNPNLKPLFTDNWQ